MHEVSAKTLELYVSEVGERNLPALFEGVGFTADNLPDRISWGLFCELTERFETLIGGRVALVNVGRSIFKNPAFGRYISMFNLVAGPRLLYWASNRFSGPKLFSNQDNTFEDVRAHCIRIEISLHDGYEDCPAYFYLNLGFFKAMPQMLGLPESVVHMELYPESRVHHRDAPLPHPLGSSEASVRRAVLGSGGV